jgi:dihydropyrimidine dehydrogenase (NAD+) subunit PreT
VKNPILKENIERFESMRHPLSLQAGIKEANRCLLCYDAPCSKACPAGTDPGKFIRQIKFLNFKGAARTIRNNNVLGSVCALICPVEKLCEEQCSALALEDPINIGGLQRFATEYGKHNNLEKNQPGKRTKAKVAIIGAGPAGLSCAAELAKRDYQITVFEKEQKAGGMPAITIPEFRLNQDALNYDIQNVMDLGVEIQFGASISCKEHIEKLKNDGFEAIFIASGLTKALKLPLLNNYQNALSYIQFLSEVKNGQLNIDVENKTVAVIGGGSVAVDSANTAKALGAKKVYLISLESLSELPADDEEVRLAQIMNIVFKSSTQITGIENANNEIIALAGQEVEWETPGNYSPSNAVLVNHTQFKIPVDIVVTAIGTAVADELPKVFEGLQTGAKNCVVANNQFQTNIPGVYAGGDVVNGGATAVEAVSHGKEAADEIDRFCSISGK